MLEEAGGEPAAAEVDAKRSTPDVSQPVLVLAAMVAIYIVVFGTLTWRQQHNLGTFGFDHGIFDQEVWLASRFKDPFVTIRGLNMWANHVNPVIYILVPFYWLGAGAGFLYLVQTVAFAAPAVALWLIAKPKLGDWMALVVPAAWLLYPSLQWMNWWHFHPEALAVAPLLFAWYFAEQKKTIPYAVCVVLVLSVKEDAALVAMMLGVLVAIRFDRKLGAATIAGSAVWLMICLKLIIPHAIGGSNPFYANQFPALGNSTGEIIFNMVRHPSRVLALATDRDRINYYGQMLLPVGLLSLASLDVLVLVSPTVLVNIVNAQSYTHNYKYQYSAIVSAGVFLALIYTLDRQRTKAMRLGAVGLLAVCTLLTTFHWSPSPLNHRAYRSGIWAHSTPHTRALAQAIKLVPASAGVAASYDLVPQLSHRVVIYEWPNPWVRSYYGIDAERPKRWSPNRVDYIALDLNLNPEQRHIVDDLLTSKAFTLVYSNADVLIAKRTPATSHHKS